jgi:hypothetical protein
MTHPSSNSKPVPEKKPEMKTWRVASKDNITPQVFIKAYGKYTAEVEYRIRFDLSDLRELDSEEVKNGSN